MPVASMLCVHAFKHASIRSRFSMESWVECGDGTPALKRSRTSNAPATCNTSAALDHPAENIGEFSDEEHLRLCRGKQCGRCHFLKNKRALTAGATWLEARFDPVGQRWGIGCVLCACANKETAFATLGSRGFEHTGIMDAHCLIALQMGAFVSLSAFPILSSTKSKVMGRNV